MPTFAPPPTIVCTVNVFSKMMKVVVAGAAAGQNNTGDASLPSWADFEPLVVYRDLDEEDAFAGFAWPGTTPSVAIS